MELGRTRWNSEAFTAAKSPTSFEFASDASDEIIRYYQQSSHKAPFTLADLRGCVCDRWIFDKTGRKPRVALETTHQGTEPESETRVPNCWPLDLTKILCAIEIFATLISLLASSFQSFHDFVRSFNLKGSESGFIPGLLLGSPKASRRAGLRLRNVAIFSSEFFPRFVRLLEDRSQLRANPICLQHIDTATILSVNVFQILF